MKEHARAQPDTVHDRLEKELMRRIDSGRLKAGDRLPAVDRLARDFSAHPITVQKALRRLKMKGVLERIPKLGTFVRAGAGLFQTAIFFGPSLTEEHTHFYRALLKALRQEQPHPGWQCFPYDGLNLGTLSGLADLPAYRHFQGDHGHYAFRGFMAVGLGDGQWDRIRMDSPGLPVARLGQGREVDMDLGHFVRESAGRLIRQGGRRIVYLRTIRPTPGPCPDLEALQSVAQAHCGVTAAVVQLPERNSRYDERVDADFCMDLVRQWELQKRWPDSLFISDDVSMRGLAHALVSRGGGRMAKTRVVTWANRGIGLHYGCPVQRYEVDPGDFARALIGNLMKRAEGGEAAPVLVKGAFREDDAGAPAAIGKPGWV